MSKNLKGSIEPYQTQSGTGYKASIDIPTDNGERNRRVERFHPDKYEDPQKNANRWLVRMNYWLGEGIYFEPSEMPLGEYLGSWMDRSKNGLSSRTIQKRERAIDHLDEKLGDLPLNKLTPFHIQEYYEEKLREYSSSTVHIHAKVLNMALREAVNQKLLDENPCEFVDSPQEEQREMQYLRPEEVERFLETVEGERPYDLLYYLAIDTGMRLGELMGLKWKDISPEENVLRVQRQLKRSEDYVFTFDSPKWDSQRKIRLGDEAIGKLEEHRKRQAERREESDEWEFDELVFTTHVGDHLKPATIRSKFKRALKEAECSVVRLQDLRHTCATLLLLRGENPKVVKERLGHKKIKTTLERYSHVMPDMQEQAAETMDDLLNLDTN